MRRRLQIEDNKAVLGSKLNARQLEMMKKASVDANQIHQHLNDLNEEIVESYNVEEVLGLNSEILNDDEEDVNDIFFDQNTEAVPIFTQETEETKVIDEPIEVNDMSNLDEELDQLRKKQEAILAKKAAAAAEEAKKAAAQPVEEAEPEMSREEMIHKELIALLAKHDGAPNEQQIAMLKKKYQDVFLMGLGEGDVYVFTFLRRSQWEKVQEYVELQVANGNQTDPEKIARQKVIQECVLWPKLTIEFFHNSRAGTIDSLYNSIMLHSYFLTPQQATMLTTQL